MADKDQIKGKLEQAKGEWTEFTGELAGDRETEQRGKMQQAKGKTQEAWGNVKDAVRDVTDRNR